MTKDKFKMTKGKLRVKKVSSGDKGQVAADEKGENQEFTEPREELATKN